MLLISQYFTKIKKAEYLTGISWHVLPPITYCLFVFLFIPLTRIFYFDSDEGYNLIKSVLLLQGHPLYTEIWSDQPPLLTALLTGFFRVFGVDVNVGRIVILGFTVLLIWAFTQIISLISSRWHALAGLLLLFVLPNFVKLSVSIMVGLPSIALATVSICLIMFWHRTKRGIWLWLAGAILALSVLTKLITGFLVPIFFAGIFIDEYLSNKKEGRPWYRLPHVIAFCTSFTLIALAGVIFLIKPSNISQLIFTHTSAQEISYYSKKTYSFGWHLKSLIPLCVLSIAGCVWVIKTKRWLAIYLIAWTVAAFIFLCFWRPVWYHHMLIFTIPCAILASMVIVDSGRYVYKASQTHGTGGFIQRIKSFKLLTWVNLFLGVLFMINWGLFGFELLIDISRIKENVQSPSSENQVCFNLLAQINSYAPQTHWFVTDVPMFTVRAHLSTPPALAVISQKRVLSGSLSTKDARQIITDTKPEQILLSGKLSSNALTNYVNHNYTLVFYKAPYKLYLLNNVYQQIHP